jgi:hypothetical protein
MVCDLTIERFFEGNRIDVQLCRELLSLTYGGKPWNLSKHIPV